MEKMPKKRRKNSFSFLDVVNILLIVYLVFPILVIVVFSFNPSTSGAFPMTGFTLKWYKSLAGNKLLLQSLVNSIYVGIAASVISVLIGTLASFALTRYKFKFKNIINFFVLVPISLPAILLGISLLSFYSQLNIEKSLLTVVISHVLFCIPFVVLVMNSRLEGFDIAVEEAAKDLGANTLQTFRYITIPLIRPSLIGVIMLAFALSFDEFLVTFFTIGTQNTLPLIIWSMLRRGVSPVINAIATLVLIFSMVLVILANKFAQMRLKI